MQTVTITYDPVLGAQYSTEQTNYVILKRPHYEKPVSSQNTQAQTPEIQRTYRHKPHNYIKLLISDDAKSQEIPVEQDIVDEQQAERKLTKHRRNKQNKKLYIPDSVYSKNMRPYMTSGQRRDVRQNLAQLFISGNYNDIDEAHFEKVSAYTPRTRHFEKPVPHNILTLPKYQRRKKEILRSGVPVKKDKNVMRIYVVRKNDETVWACFEPVVR